MNTPVVQACLFFGGCCEEVVAFYAKHLGAKVEMTVPLGKTFGSACFGMLTDRFGVGWMVTIPTPG